MATIQNIVGHATEKMTSHYLHLSDDSIKREMSQFPKLLIHDKEDVKEKAIEVKAVEIPLY
jgi:hypothetical protein